MTYELERLKIKKILDETEEAKMFEFLKKIAINKSNGMKEE
jgi:hypothetical protein